MSKVDLDFSPLFEDAHTPKERMLAFGSRIDSLVGLVENQELPIDFLHTLPGDEGLHLEVVRVPKRPYRQKPFLPGVALVNDQNQLWGALANGTREEQGIFGKRIVGGIHFLPPRLGEGNKPFSIVADSSAFKEPGAVDLDKEEFRTFVRKIGGLMLLANKPELDNQR